MPKNDPTATEGMTDRPKDSTRKRMTLNMSKREFATLEKIAEVENCSIASAIKRSAETRWSIHTAQHPAWRWDAQELEHMGKLPDPHYYAIINEVTGEITRTPLTNQ